MAVAPESIFKKINEHLTCDICLEVYKQPKNLPCQHTFCCECLKDYARKQLSKTEFPCPLCRQTTVVPPGGVSEFPTNFVIKNLAEEVGSSQSEQATAESTPAVCDSCEANEKPGVIAVAFCEECAERLCRECVEAHARLKLTRDHAVTELPQGSSPNKKSEKKTKARKKKSREGGDAGAVVQAGGSWRCKVHTEQDVQCFCITCSSPLCGACLTELIGQSKHKHTGHKIEPLEGALDTVKQELENQLSEVQELCSEAAESVTYLADLENALENSHRNVITDIQDAADHVKTIADRWADNMAKKAEILKDEKREELVAEMRTLQATVTKLKAGEQSARDKIKTSGTKVVLKRRELMTQLTELRKSYSCPPMPQPIRFTLTEVLDDTTSVRLHSMMGEIRADSGMSAKAESMTSLLSDPSMEAEVRRPAVSVKVVCSFRPVRGKMTGICVTRGGMVFAVDQQAKVILQYGLNDKYRFTLMSKFGEKSLSDPLDVDQLTDGRVVVSDGKAGHSVKVFEAVRGKPQWRLSGNIAHSLLKKATGIATTPDNQILVTDVDQQAVYRIELQGGDRFKVNMEIRKYKDNLQFDSPQFIACSQTGDLVVSDRTHSCVKIYDRCGRFKTKFGSWGMKGRQMRKPGGVCYDAEGRVFIADVLNKRIQVLGRDSKHVCYIPWLKACGKFVPSPDMVAVTPQGDLLLANEEGFVKILKIDFS